MFRHEPKERPEILVVDDDPMVRDIVVESIRIAGYEVDVCGDGVEALKKNEEKNYDFIVTDMRLPGMDGLSLIKRLKASSSNTDVIVITGYGSIENAVACMRAGALEYLIKPFTVDQIQVAVRKAIEHRELRRKAMEREFYRELSYVDALTGIHNRRYLNEALSAEVQKALRLESSFILLMIDIDDFKLYNDRNGHQKGDQALAQIGKLLKSACRGYDIVARYGGEEFAIVFPGAGPENAPELAERILRGIADEKFNGEDLLPSGSLTVSIGVACFPEHACTGDELIRCADKALYEAKRTGKNKIKIAASHT
ncbi:MAG: diguanylate cyclase [Desulfomonile tiedjei]|uniref:diguanylate cyclase n=1 Tax=Desulfomonile tiedjei TaxID=2358 RepID=A0A9D6V3E4_9BACT|nr:diguanylate cyclase [Desulfomonile tiedjei]